MIRKFIVIAEAPPDFRTATEIADRVFIAGINWLEEAQLDSQRNWIGELPAGCPLTWKSIPGLARATGIHVHGHFDGEPGLPDAHAARRALAYVLRIMSDIAGIVLIRDTDDQPQRRLGLEQARTDYASLCAIVVGVAICERESWVLCGFVPRDESENAALDAERQNIGFDPCIGAQRLTAGRDDTALKSPKRVLRVLSRGNPNREEDCWRSTELKLLFDRGRQNGLREYMEELRTRLVPAISGREGTPFA